MQRMNDSRRPRSPAPLWARRQCLGLAVAAVCLPRPATASHVVQPWPMAKLVPMLELDDLDGRRWALASQVGKVVVLNFWATWCEPCRHEMPSLHALAARRRRDGLVVVAVNYREPAALIREFLNRVAFKPHIVRDVDGEATTAWTPHVFPSTVLVGRDGQPSATVLGGLDWTGPAASALVEPLLVQRRPSTSSTSRSAEAT